MKHSATLFAITLVAIASASTIVRRVEEGRVGDSINPVDTVSPAETRFSVPDDCPPVESIDVAKWSFQEEGGAVGLSEFYRAKYGVRDQPGYPPTSVDFEWIGRIRTRGAETCVYLMHASVPSHSWDFYHIAKTPARSVVRRELDDTDADVARQLGYYITEISDGDRGTWLLNKIMSISLQTAYETAERHLQRLVGQQECHTSLTAIRNAVRSMALDVLRKLSVLLADDALRPGNVLFNKEDGMKVQLLVFAVRGYYEEPDHPQATIILDSAIKAAFPNSLCDPVIARFERSKIKANKAHLLSHRL